MGALLPKWAMGDPAIVCERLEEYRRRPQKPRLSRQEQARQGLEQLFSEDHMTKDESEQLEELLMTWYHWAKAHREHLGHSRVALLGAIGGSLANAMADARTRETALITFLATAANVTLLGVGGAFWGLVAGLTAHLLIHGGQPRLAGNPAKP